MSVRTTGPRSMSMWCVHIILSVMLNQTVGADAASQPASQPAPPALPSPISTFNVLDGFVKHLQERRDVPADAARFVREQFDARKSGDNLASLLDESLALVSPDFKAALDAQAGGGSGAAERFVALAKNADPYVAVNGAFFAAGAWIAEDKVRDAAGLLDAVYREHEQLTRYTTHADHMLFLLGFTQGHMLQYDEARATLTRFIVDYPAAPERYRASAQQMLVELNRRQPGRLGDVYDLMDYSHRELALGRTDEDVSGKQDEAARLLSRLIKEAEDEEKKGGSGGKGGGGGRSGGRRSPGNKPCAPRQRSETSPGGESETDLHRARTARPGESWGNMPPKEREQILQALQKQFPSQYRELVEQYYRQISKDAPRP